MRTSLLTLAAGLFLLSPVTMVRAEDDLDDFKRQQKVIADKFDAEMREGLADAAKLARSGKTKDAHDILAGLEVRLQLDKGLSPERRQELTDVVKSRMSQYKQQAASNLGGGGPDERIR